MNDAGAWGRLSCAVDDVSALIHAVYRRPVPVKRVDPRRSSKRRIEVTYVHKARQIAATLQEKRALT